MSKHDLSPAFAAKAAELLGDREWHSYEQVIREMSKLVPPGIAIRRNEVDRQHNYLTRTGRPGTAPKNYRSDEERIRSGARSIVRDYLNKKLVFEKDQPPSYPGAKDPGRQIRMIGTPRPAHPVRDDGDRESASTNTTNRWLSKEVIRLSDEMGRLKDQVAAMRGYLLGTGHLAAVERLDPYDTGGRPPPTADRPEGNHHEDLRHRDPTARGTRLD